MQAGETIALGAAAQDGGRAALQRTGFWRTQIDVLALSLLAAALVYLVRWIAPSPWPDLLALLTLAVYPWGAWRLAPGRGAWARRAGRVLAWGLLAALLGGVAGWALTFLPHPLYSGVAGIGKPSLALVLASSAAVVLPLFGGARVVLHLHAASRARLRWQLAISYLLVSSLTTLLVYLVIGLYLGISSLAIEPALIEPTIAAERTAAAIEPLVRVGTPPETLRATLAGLRDGTARVPVAAGEALAEGSRPALNGIRRATLLHLGGGGAPKVVASAPDAPPEATLASLRPVLAAAAEGQCASGRPAGGTLADTAACPLRDARGALVGVVLVETDYANPAAQTGAALGRIIAVAGATLGAALASLMLTVAVSLLLAAGGGYLLARRLTRRVEAVAGAAHALAAGHLDRRLAVDRDDELGRLSRDFNTMAERLAEREHALLAEKERAESLLAGNRRLVADVSHELRTPLATLRGYLEALDESHGAQLPAHDMAVLHGEVGRLTGLIEDLFTLARADAQRLPLAIAPVDALALLRRLADALAPLARRDREVEVVATLPERLPQVAADPTRLEQVLLNLAQNALRHTPPGGIVALEAKVAPDGVVLSVADTGVGIPPEELDLIFERFYRGDASRARETGGAGLGLALVRELVTAMGGSVEVSSQPGRGSRFSLRLPSADGTYS